MNKKQKICPRQRRYAASADIFLVAERQDVRAEGLHVVHVAWGIVVADVDVPVGGGAELHGTSDCGGGAPDDLGEVTSRHGEAGAVVIVLLLLIVPGSDSVLKVSMTGGQVLTKLDLENKKE